MAQDATEGNVDWKSAEEFFTGQAKDAEAATPTPEGDAPAQPQAPNGDLVPVRIKGRQVMMSKEAADAHAEFVRETRERDGRLGGEIANLRERSARLEGMIETVRAPQRAADDIEPPPAKLAIENYEEYHRQMLAYNAAMMMRQQVEIEQKYNSDQGQRQAAAREEARKKAWADGFYAENPHLNKPRVRDLVVAVYRDNHKEIDSLINEGDVTGANERLAELADEALLDIKKGEGRPASQQANTSNRPPHLEGAGTPSNDKGSKADRFTPVSSASWVSRKRAALRGEKVRKD